MYIQVKLLNGYQQSLWYKIPPRWHSAIAVGTIVQVPLRNQIIPAVVIHDQKNLPQLAFAIKEIIEPEPFPADSQYQLFTRKLSAYYQIEPMHFVKRIAHFLIQEAKNEDAVLGKQSFSAASAVQLTAEQQVVCDFLLPRIATPVYTPTVLHGVTGSGKTEIYKQLMLHAFEQGKTTVLLLPEVTLAISFEKRLRVELGDAVTLCGFHSGSTPKQKRALWQQLLAQKPLVIIGVHLPIMLPIANLGLIIIDEEHEVGYQEKKHPKINSKEAAILRASMYGIPIILGSATPSVATLYNIQKHGWHFFQIKNRFAGSFPTVKTVLLTDKKQRKNFWISTQLYEALKDRIEKKQQAIIFLNRRGFSFFVQCKECTFIFSCKACSVSLTLHTGNRLHCHYCDFSMTLPSHCAGCQADEKQFLYKGIGTQQVVTILQKLFPFARIARADMDTTVKKKVWQQTMQDFVDGNIDILVGTQTITKGYDFQNVTLVGVLWADLNLHFPVYNAAEVTLQQLIQVAGRAGRKHADSLVIVQAMADHSIFSYLNEIEYLNFNEYALSMRSQLGYPPCKRLVEIEIKNTDEEKIELEASDILSALINAQRAAQCDVQILGPAKPPVHKIKDTHVRKIYLKGGRMSDIIALFGILTISRYTSSIFFVPNPIA
jgi:primosomal protein N' (replication factor Y)